MKRKISLTCCDVCENKEAKYRCPNCLKFSCSLPCVKRHKLQSGCSGVRDKTAFVALSQFSEINLLNDYRYLEETARVADKPNRDTILQTLPYLSYTVKLLNKNATAAKVNLILLPRSFTRHMENTSIYMKVEKKLYWHLKLHFPQSSVEYTDRVPEDRVLQEILTDYIHPTESDPVKRQRLKLYVQTPPDEMCVFLKSEKRWPGSPKYHELNMKKTLRENMMFKTILEYPELYMVLKEHHKEYLTKFPERRSAGQSSSPKISSTTETTSHLVPSSSRDVPEATVCPRHVVKKRKIMAEESELEDGEIRSEEEEDEDASNAKGHNRQSMASDLCLPHNDKVQSGGAENEQSLAMKTNDPSCQGGGADAVDVINLNKMVTMETGHDFPHDRKEKDTENEGDGGTANNLTLETNNPSVPSDLCKKNDEDCKVASVADHLLPSPQEKDMGDNQDGDGHQGCTAQDSPSSHNLGKENVGGQVDCVDYHPAANEQKVTMETNGQLPEAHSKQGGDKDQVHGEKNEEDENEEDQVDKTANMETDGHPFSTLDKNIIEDVPGGDVHQGTMKTSTSDQSITMESAEAPSLLSPHDPKEEENKCRVQSGADSAFVHDGENKKDQIDKTANMENNGNYCSLNRNLIEDVHQVHVDQSITMGSNDPPPSPWS